MTLSPRILSISALPALGSVADLRPGVHLRWTYHPVLGFPNGPVEISRAALNDGLAKGCSVLPVHISELGHGLGATLPFSVPAGQSVWCRPSVGASGTLAVRLVVEGIVPERVVGGLLGPEGFVPVQHGSTQGSNVIWVTASGINAVRVIGPGRITVASAWSLECARRLKFERIAMVGPPFDGLAGYESAPIADPVVVAERRVRAGSPLVVSLVDAIGPTTLAPGTNDEDREWDRVQSFVDSQLRDRYENMLDHPTSPLSHRQPEHLEGSSGTTVATLDAPSYALLMAATRDPSIARWAGLSMVDLKPITQNDSVYRIRASFDLGRVFPDSEETETVLAALERHGLGSHDLDIANPRVVLEAFVAVVPSSQPPLPPPGNPVAQHVRWVESTPNLRRLVDVDFDQPVGAVAYAWYRKTGGTFEPMNSERTHTAYRMLDPGTRRTKGSNRWMLTDPGVSLGAATYGIAATDAFGRWSTWSIRSVAPGPFVPPPPPVLQAEYLVAPITPVDNTPRAGTIRATIPVPEALPPGCEALDSVHIRIESLAGPIISSTSIALGSATTIMATLAGPVLERTETKDVRAAAQFEAGGVRSRNGVARVTVADGRPPSGLTIAPDLHWTTRSDARDSSRIVLDWASQPGHRGYRVYLATSRTLVDHFSSLGATGAEALETMSSPNAGNGEVVAALAPHTATLPRSAFELLTSRMIDTKPAGCNYELVVPGRSRLLYLVRITAVGPNNVDEDWSGPPALFFVAAPPTVKVQPPELAVAGATQPVNSVRVTATLRSGQRAVAWRLFRTTKPDLAVAGKMSELMTETVTLPPPPPPSGNGEFRPPLATLEYSDQGPSVYRPTSELRPWRTYIYRAQLQGESEPGGPAGVWSDLSMSVSTTIVPPDDPPTAVVSATRVFAGLDVSWTCDLPARRTAMGDFRFRVLIREVGASVPQEVASVTSLGLLRHLHEQEAASGPYPPLEVLVETIDPIGRRSISDPVRVEAGL